jgi:CSLREA domain-containing protein
VNRLLVPILLALGAVAPAAQAAELTVTTTADTTVACTPSACSLRAAVIAANADPGSTITVPAGRYTLTIAGTGEESAATGDLDVRAETTIEGAGSGSTIIDAAGLDRVIDLTGFLDVDVMNKFCPSGPPDVAISGVTITGGARVTGAGINDVCGTLTLDDVVIERNTGVGGAGAILVETGMTTTATRTWIRDNAQGGSGNPGGGAILVASTGTLVLRDSLVSGNTSGGGMFGLGQGGGILNQGTATLTNVTVSGNQVAGDMSQGTGGGISTFSGGTTTLINSTIAGNGAGGPGASLGCGGNLAVSQTCGGAPDGTLVLKNTIVADGRGIAGTENCSAAGATTSEGHNLEDDDQCGLGADGDKVDTDPLLGALADNGGPTPTRALLGASPAADAAAADDCPATDQRGVARPQAAACDIGAFELVPQADLSVSLSAPAEVASGAERVVTLTVRNDGPQPAAGVELQTTVPGAITAIGTLAPGEQRTFSATSRPTAAVTDTATVEGAYADPDPADDTASVTTRVVAVVAAAGPAPKPPVITDLRARARCVRAAALRTRAASDAGGISFTYTLDQAADVLYVVKRRKGSRGKTRCTPPSGRSQTGYDDVGTLTGPGAAGANTARIASRSRRHTRARRLVRRAGAGRHRVTLARIAQGRALAPGTYVLLVRARNAAGQASNDAMVKFFVLSDARRR